MMFLSRLCQRKLEESGNSEFIERLRASVELTTSDVTLIMQEVFMAGIDAVST